MKSGKARILGTIQVPAVDGGIDEFPYAILIEFDTPEELKQAIRDQLCSFEVLP
jgi:hypothetical protein